MRILAIRFHSSARLADLAQPFKELAAQIAQVHGLRWKVFVHEGDHVVGGIYLFDDQASVDAYLAGPIVAGIQSNPAFSDIRVEQYDVAEEPTAITRGPVAIPV